jgi:hypothetical protein
MNELSFQTDACKSHFPILVAGRQTSKFKEMVIEIYIHGANASELLCRYEGNLLIIIQHIKTLLIATCS